MLDLTRVMDAVNLRLVELWPSRTVYVDVCPQNFDRPSIWIQTPQDDFQPVGHALYQRTITISITLFDQQDPHYEVSWSRLARDVAQVQRALLAPVVVDGRHLIPAVMTKPREADNALILVRFDFLDNFDCPQPPEPPMDGMLHVRFQVDGKSVGAVEAPLKKG